MGIRRRSKQIASTVSHGHIVSTQSAIEGDGAFHYDSTSGKKALAAVAPELEALGDDLVVVRIDVQKSAYAALEVARHVQSPEVRSRFAELPVQAFDMRNADGLGEIAMATIFAGEQAQDLGALNTEARLPPALAAEATELEQRMQTVCEYNLSDDPEIRPLLDELRPGTGYWDLLNDLKGYARIYERRASAVKADGKNYRPGDLKRCKEITALMGRLFFADMSNHARASYETFVRCWMLLAKRYEEVRQTGLWLFRTDALREKRFPSLYSVARPNAGRRRKEPVSAPSDSPSPGGSPVDG